MRSKILYIASKAVTFIIPPIAIYYAEKTNTLELSEAAAVHFILLLAVSLDLGITHLVIKNAPKERFLELKLLFPLSLALTIPIIITSELLGVKLETTQKINLYLLLIENISITILSIIFYSKDNLRRLIIAIILISFGRALVFFNSSIYNDHCLVNYFWALWHITSIVFIFKNSVMERKWKFDIYLALNSIFSFSFIIAERVTISSISTNTFAAYNILYQILNISTVLLSMHLIKENYINHAFQKRFFLYDMVTVFLLSLVALTYNYITFGEGMNMVFIVALIAIIINLFSVRFFFMHLWGKSTHVLMYSNLLSILLIIILNSFLSITLYNIIAMHIANASALLVGLYFGRDKKVRP